MEAYFLRKALAMHKGFFAPGGIVCSTKSPKKCISSENFDRLSENKCDGCLHAKTHTHIYIYISKPHSIKVEQTLQASC